MDKEHQSSIYIAIPSYERKVDVEIMTLVSQLSEVYGSAYTFGLDFISSSLISHARNCLARNFLDHKEFEWMYFWDSDIVIRDVTFFKKLIETSKNLNAQIVGGVYRIKHNGGQCVTGNLINGEIKNLSVDEIKEPQLVDVIGGGSMLIHRSVLERIPPPYFSFIDKKDEKILPEDYYFCLKARDAGVNIAIDPRFTTHHYGPAFWEYRTSDRDE